MKKVLLTKCLTFIAAFVFAQVPQTGLTDHWRLNANLRNEISGRPYLLNEGFHTCLNSFGDPTIIIRHSDTANFVPNRNAETASAYWCRIKQGPPTDSAFCSEVPPNGIWLMGPPNTALETSAKFYFANDSRTIALWAKANSTTGNHRLFFTGAQAAKKAFGLDLKPGSNTVTLFTWGGGANDVDATVENQDTLWHHYAATYDGATLKLYRDGQLLDSSAVTNLNTSFDFIRFGTSNSNVYLDEILIYNRALSATEVGLVYAETITSIPDLMGNKVLLSVFPNPTNDVLNIESNEEIASIKITDITGRIIITENNLSTFTTQFTASQLADATYFIHIKTTSGKISVKTFVKN